MLWSSVVLINSSVDKSADQLKKVSEMHLARKVRLKDCVTRILKQNNTKTIFQRQTRSPAPENPIVFSNFESLQSTKYRTHAENFYVREIRRSVNTHLKGHSRDAANWSIHGLRGSENLQNAYTEVDKSTRTLDENLSMF